MQSPHTRQLCRSIGTGVVVALEELLIQQLHAVGLGEVGIMPVPRSTYEARLLKAAVPAQSAVILYVGCKRSSLAQLELTRNLRISTLGEAA